MSILWFVFHNSLYLHAKIIDQQGELHSQIPDELWTKAREYTNQVVSVFSKGSNFQKNYVFARTKAMQSSPFLDYLVVQNSGILFC